MHKALRGVWYVLFAFGLFGCGPKVQPGLGVDIVINDGAHEGVSVTRVSAHFDRKMVRVGMLGEEILDGPLKIEPKVPGRLIWKEDRKLVLEFDEPLPRSSRFKVIVPQGTQARDGFGLTEDVVKVFDTLRLRLRTTPRKDWNLPDPKTHATVDQSLRLEFNQSVTPANVVKHCEYQATSGNVDVEVISRESTDKLHFLEVTPKKPLRLDTPWRFICSEELRPEVGKLGLLIEKGTKKHTNLNGTYPDGILDFRTFGPMKVVEVSPEGKEVDPDTTSIKVTFSNPPGRLEGGDEIKIVPRPRDVRKDLVLNGRTVTMAVAGLEPGTSYTVKVAAGIADRFDQKLEAPFEVSFTTGNIEPGFTLETGSKAVEKTRGAYVGWARNIESVEVQAAAVKPRDLFKLLPKIRWWDEEPVDLKKLKIDSVQKTLTVKGPKNRWNQVEFSPTELFGTEKVKGRFFYIAASAPSLFPKDEVEHREVLLNLTNLGLTSKFSPNTGLVWTTNINDGTPEPDAKISIYSRAGHVLWVGSTDSQGIAKTPGMAELREKAEGFKKRRAKAEETDDEHDYNYSYGYEADYLIFAELDGDITFVDPERTGGFTAWNFGVSRDRSSGPVRLRGFLHTDRGLYRPGDEVHLRGLARTMVLGQGLGQPRGQKVKVTVSDPRGEEILRKKLSLSKFGSFHLTVKTEDDAPLGDYRVVADLEEGSFAAGFTVEEYRPATFEVDLSSKKDVAITGRDLVLKASADYFYGAPVRGGEVSWSAHSRSRAVSFDGYRGYNFENYSEGYRYHDPWGIEAFVTEVKGVLDDKGRGAHKLELPPSAFKQPSTLLLRATVSDETNQSVSANLTVPLHTTMSYLGINTGGWMVPAGKSHKIKAVALDVKGQPIEASAELLVEKHEWSCAFEKWGYRGSYRCNKKTTKIESRNLTFGLDGPVEQEVTIPGPGEYWFILRGKDKRGNPIIASDEVWAYGKGESPWYVDDSGKFDILADKDKYQVGDVAKLLVKAPLEGASGLLTIERDGVLSHRLIPSFEDGEALEIPIEDKFAPNAYATLMLVRGRMGPGSRGLPQITMGVVNLKVDHGHKRLKVSVRCDKEEYRPGEEVTATIKVVDQAGKPVNAEVALAAADEGVLSLIGFSTPDPIGRFYAPWGLAVDTATAYERLHQVPAPGEERYATGGDGPGMPGTIRSRMRATAYWNPGIETDRNGEASVTFKAPDNLTAYRLMAVAADVKERFGSSDKRFKVNKPLQILSALPRFASVGDRFDAAIMITNETGGPGEATVKLRARGVKMLGGQTQTIRLEKGGRARVAFPVQVRDPGTGVFTFTAQMGDEQDGLETKIPLYYPTSEETTTLSAGHTSDQVTVAVSLPSGVMEGTAQLVISVDPDGLAGLENSLLSLIRYPYGCLEQTTSRLIPLVAVKEIFEGLGLDELDDKKLKKFVKIAVGKLGRFQDHSGGFGLWVGSSPEPYLTSYALFGLKLARDAGFEVDQKRIDRGVEYLRGRLSSSNHAGGVHSELGEWGSRAFAVYVLGELERPDNGYATSMVQKVDSLPAYGVAFLASALARSLGSDHPTVTELVARLENAMILGEDTAYVKESDSLGYYMSSDVRTTAVVLDLFLRVKPKSRRVPQLARWLLDHREHGRWQSTQENVWGLTALSNYVQSSANDQTTVVAALDGKELFDTVLSSGGKGRLFRFETPLKPDFKGALEVRAQNGTAHYLVNTAYRRDMAHQEPRSEGFALERTFLNMMESPIVEATEGEMVRVRMKIGTEDTRHHVALSNYLPAGLEPINTKFKTSAQNVSETTDAGRRRSWSLSYKDLRDERVDAFWSYMYHGDYYLEFLTRATTAGEYVVPAATCEEMYNPKKNARTALGKFTVKPK